MRSFSMSCLKKKDFPAWVGPAMRIVVGCRNVNILDGKVSGAARGSERCHQEMFMIVENEWSFCGEKCYSFQEIPKYNNR